MALLYRSGGGYERANLSRRLNSRDYVHSFISWASLRECETAMVEVEEVYRPDLSAPARADFETPGSPYLHWTPILAGAIVAAAVSFVLLSFGSAIGLEVASPSSTWRDTSWVLALLAGLWLLLTSLASFGLGGYLAGRLRGSWSPVISHEVEFRDGIHGLLVWGLAIIIGVFLAFAATKTVAPRPGVTGPAVGTAEPLLAFELDRVFRSDRRPADAGGDFEIRAQAARIITSGLGHSSMAPEDRAYLLRLVEIRTGLTQPEAESRVDRAITQSSVAIKRARSAAVILAFMIGASLMLGAAIAWLASASGGQHRDGSVDHAFWRRRDVNRVFFVR
jgi:hypothetical protein